MVRSILNFQVVEVAKLGVDAHFGDVGVVGDVGVHCLGIIFRLKKSGSCVMVEDCLPAREICTKTNVVVLIAGAGSGFYFNCLSKTLIESQVVNGCTIQVVRLHNRNRYLGKSIFGGRVFSSVRGRVDTYTSGQGSPAAIQVFFLVIFCLELQLLDKVSVDMKVLAIIKK